ncbi:MalY/PatB family protein [Bacillus sp. 1NLA3E]|uniref:MalY/PatB family protein n=1 Tax=Bacillus sp. 1NLA3E TaxID=666686 RepID=UPI000247F3A3|nr:MalY/PatB family protein [Bacillus sp. 1NLA3E]AGK55453.1 class I and II aminotransferase [Bacillus sp. 1NLA3E]
MASSDFHKIFNRTQTASVKWEMTKKIFGTDDLLPMWVADMDFQPPQEVMNAIQHRAEHGIYGYTFIPPSTGDAIHNWMALRHNWKIDTPWIEYSSGVVPAISTVIQALTNPGEQVMLQSPVYTPFFDMIERNGRIMVNTPLETQDHRFQINFDLFEQNLKQGVKLFLLCNPHNPGGRVWTKEELLQIGKLCLKYNCKILSDEIHSDLVFKPAIHIPIASLSPELEQNVITCVAPSKTFNIAGLQASAMIIPNPKWRAYIKKFQHRQGFFSLNLFGITAMEAAYRYGEKWLEELLSYLSENVSIAKRYIEKNVPAISVMEPEGTYLLWLDCRNLGFSDNEIKERLLKRGKLALEPGAKYGQGGEGFVRMNLACPQEILLDGLKRLQKSFE